MIMGSRYENVKKITEDLEQGIRELMNDPDGAYQKWLTVMSRFHHYSLNNTLLILQQKPDAELVAGYQTWKQKFGKQVKKGARAIRILAPSPYKKIVETPEYDPATKEPKLRPDGDPVTIKQEIIIPAFRVVNVFDVADTEGRELPSLGPDELKGNVDHYEMLLKALIKASPVPVGFEEIKNGSKGYFHTVENRIAINQGMSEAQTIKTLLHEMAHQKCHSIKAAPGDKARSDISRMQKEQEAESVAYTVCRHFGIDTAEYSFSYVASWAQDKEITELRASMNTIRGAAAELIDTIEEKLAEVSREKTSEKEAALPEAEKPESLRQRIAEAKASLLTRSQEANIIGRVSVRTSASNKQNSSKKRKEAESR